MKTIIIIIITTGIYKAHISTMTGTHGATSLSPLLTVPMKKSKCHLSSLGNIQLRCSILCSGAKSTISDLTGTKYNSWVERSKWE